MALLKSIEKEQTLPYYTRLPALLKKELGEVRKQAVAVGLKFDDREIVTRAIQAAVRTAQAELSAHSAKAAGK